MGNRQSTLKSSPGYSRLYPESFVGKPFASYIGKYTHQYYYYMNLAGRAQGGRIVDVSDEFFASADNLLQTHEPVSKPNTYTENGAWMDGWESRRHNPDHDWVIIKLGFPGSIVGFDINTGHFNGNQAPEASVEACFISEDTLKQGGDIDFDWDSVLPRVDLGPASKHYFMLDSPTPVYNFVRLRIYPDGKQLMDLAFVGNGGRVVAQSDQHYTPSSNLILPERGHNMGDGWETKRSRIPNHCDWVLVRLGMPGKLEKCEIDTHYFKGNFPDGVELDACYSDVEDPSLETDVAWFQILPRQRLSAHQQHHFSLDLRDRAFTHVRMTIFPDGGVMRLRVYGRPLLAESAKNEEGGVVIETSAKSSSATSTPIPLSRTTKAETTDATPSPGSSTSTSTVTSTATDSTRETTGSGVSATASMAASNARSAHRKRSRRERAIKENGDDEEYVEETITTPTIANGKGAGRKPKRRAVNTPVATPSSRSRKTPILDGAGAGDAGGNDES
ncbi:galactose-binding domain-like protein [Syncephalis plumigaleata]|nr:galactose-binding domain-like protein [Syncephalis plumigaleata]